MEQRPGFSEQFPEYLLPDEAEVRTAVATGMVVLDTNVLLSAYRFAPAAREELLTAIERLGDRVWVPHQVGLEFHRNRYSVIADHAAAYRSALDAIEGLRATIRAELEPRLRYLSLRTGLPSADLTALLDTSLDPLRDGIEELQSAHGSGLEVLDRLRQIFDGRIGTAFTEPESRTALAEARRRVEHRIPPGYMDAEKPSSEGDYFVWRQILDEAAARKPAWLVFVTDDMKEDWLLRAAGTPIGARFELATEALHTTGARLLLLQTRTFLRHIGSVSAETIRQADDMASSARRQRMLEIGAALTRLDAEHDQAARVLASVRSELTPSQHLQAIADDLEQRIAACLAERRTLQAELPAAQSVDGV